MGAWGKEPWDNDKAADWFGDLWDRFPLVNDVHVALGEPSGETAMAALWFCTELCRIYVWPIDRYEETLDHAIAAADRLLAGEDENELLALWNDSEVTDEVQRMRQVLIGRRDALQTR